MKVKHAYLLTITLNSKLASLCLLLEALASHLHLWQRIVLLQPAQVTLQGRIIILVVQIWQRCKECNQIGLLKNDLKKKLFNGLLMKTYMEDKSDV